MSATSEPRIEHVVVVMFENRSFDHLLGFLVAPPIDVHRRILDALNIARRHEDLGEFEACGLDHRLHSGSSC